MLELLLDPPISFALSETEQFEDWTIGYDTYEGDLENGY